MQLNQLNMVAEFRDLKTLSTGRDLERDLLFKKRKKEKEKRVGDKNRGIVHT